MENIHFTWQLLVSILAGLWEVIVRLLPTVPVKYSWIQKVIDILVWLSGFLNRKKKQ